MLFLVISLASLCRFQYQLVSHVQGVTWSTATTLQETVQAAAALGLSVSHEALPVLQDIDTVEVCHCPKLLASGCHQADLHIARIALAARQSDAKHQWSYRMLPSSYMATRLDR